LNWNVLNLLSDLSSFKRALLGEKYSDSLLVGEMARK